MDSVTQLEAGERKKRKEDCRCVEESLYSEKERR